MLENQLIQFTGSIDPLKAEVAMQTREGDTIRFFFFNYYKNENVEVDIVTPSGEVMPVSIRKRIVDKTIDGCILIELSYSGLANRELYRIRLTDEDGMFNYSNLMINDLDARLSEVEFMCYDYAFDIPFGKGNSDEQYLIQPMPINLHSPQYKQKDKIYTKRNGEQVVLYANITKEYEGETDYIPMEWHEKILMALSCDEVYINGERVTKSNTYEIDHENVTYTDCGIKLMRATFKVTKNVTQRNSNY